MEHAYRRKPGLCHEDRPISGPEKRVLEAYLILSKLRPIPPSHEMLAERSGVSERVVPDYLRSIEQRGLIQVRQRRRWEGERQ